MREQMEDVLKKELRFLALKERNRCGYTQEQMSEVLMMSKRSYSDIECGISACGTLTAILLILHTEDPNLFLYRIEKEFRKLMIKEKIGV